MTAARTSHDDLRDNAALYALGALEPAETAEFERHLSSCAECAAELRALRPTVGALAGAVPQIDPPAGLRERVLASAGHQRAVQAVPERRAMHALAPWLAAAASVVLAVGLGIYNRQLREDLRALTLELGQTRARLATTEREIENARGVASNAQAMVRVIAAPDLRRSDLAGQPAAPGASARAFWSRSRGLVFAASNLPPLPAGRTYQLWIVPPGTAAPVSAGTFEPDASGRVERVVERPIDTPRAAAMAVTIEPAGGVPAPTGDKYLVGTVSEL